MNTAEERSLAALEPVKGESQLRSEAYYRGWDYAQWGDYHKRLDPNWAYTPTYIRKMKYVRCFLDCLDSNVRILDLGCGEGVLVEEYRSKGFEIEGLDLNYSSPAVRRGSVLDMSFYEDERFAVVLMLDVFEHLEFADQPRALEEIKRVLEPGGTFLIAVPNLGHLNSRFRLLVRGLLDRTDVETNHSGERPMKENMKLLRRAGFEIIRKKGITLSVPVVYRRIICRWPARFRWLHDALEPFAFPSLAMLDIFTCKKVSRFQCHTR